MFEDIYDFNNLPWVICYRCNIPMRLTKEGAEKFKDRDLDSVKWICDSCAAQLEDQGSGL
jgi:hypothetical protein